MIDLLRWTVAIEVIGIAFLPLTFRLFRALPDRGYIFGRMIGLVVITYVTWLVGSVVPVASSPILPALVLLAAGGLGWWWLRPETIETLRSLRQTIVLEEVLFLAGLLFWSYLRAQVFHPGIGHTEQYMDMSFLGASIRSASYPPYDPWMSGHTINYYYLGYLMFGLLVKLSGVAPTVGYNLALSFISAFALAGAFSLGFALTRHYVWAALSPLFLTLVGNWHAILVQLPNHQDPAGTYYWFWGSTRVIGSNTTITEFPFFSFMLGDLHPHVMSIPVVLLALAFGCNFVHAPAPPALRKSVQDILPLLAPALTIGMLFTINSWDFPTYLLLVAICIGVQAYLSDEAPAWWRVPAQAIVAIAVTSIVLYLPFYLRFRSPTHGIGTVTNPTDIWEFLQVMGILLLPAVVFIGSLALLFQPTGEVDEQPESYGPTGARATEAGSAVVANAGQIAAYGLLFVVVILAAHAHLWVLLLMLAVGIGTLLVLYRVLHAEDPSRHDAVALVFILVACIMLALPEVVYIRDSFDGSSMYRMNTLFKLYYQAWILLAAAGGYCVYRGWDVLRRYFPSGLAWTAAALIALGTLGGLYYSINAPQSANQGGLAQSLDGSAALQANAAGDYAAVQWLKDHTGGNPVELEATGGEYDTRYARISTFTGLPTVIGWAGHEFQWRGSDPQIQQRVNDVKTVYTTADAASAEALLRKYGVRYVVVGATERLAYPGPGLTKFASFMHAAFTSGDTTVYTW